MKPQKSREELAAALAAHTPIEVLATEVVNTEVVPYKPTNKQLVTDSEEDYNFTRDRVKKLIETSDEAITRMLDLASDSEHPRAFEVLANLLKTASDVNQQLITIHKDRKKILSDETGGKKVMGVTENNTTNNSIFVGTTADLQKYLKTNSGIENNK